MAWLDHARQLIAEIDATLPANATVAERDTALRANAWRHHGGTSWGKKTWQRARKEYLGRFIKSDAAVPEKHLSPLERMMKKAKDAAL